MTKKVRVNVTVDEVLLVKAKKKLHLFGGKLSTLFNIYLKEFARSMDASPAGAQSSIEKRVAALEKKVRHLESK